MDRAESSRRACEKDCSKKHEGVDVRIKIVGVAVVLASVLASAASWAAQPAPLSWTLSVQGNVRQGAIVSPILKKQREIGLVVFKQPDHAEVGSVPLGTFSDDPSIPWNLKVGSKVLGSGSYQVDLVVFANGRPTNTLGPPPHYLKISGRHVVVTG
jgi:hypothetical protein